LYSLENNYCLVQEDLDGHNQLYLYMLEDSTQLSEKCIFEVVYTGQKITSEIKQYVGIAESNGFEVKE
jgi:hypothetical protein